MVIEKYHSTYKFKKAVLVGDAKSMQEIIFCFPKLARIELTNSENTLVEDIKIKIYSAFHAYVTLINDGTLKVS